MESTELMAILNSFTSASIDTIQDMAGISAQKGKVEKKYNSINSSGVSTILGINGKYKGRVLLDMTPQTAKSLIEKINDENVKEIDEMALYMIIELNNIISGVALTEINNTNQDYKFRLTPPGVFWGEDIKISSSDFQVLSTEIITDVGNVNLNLNIEGVDI